MNNKGFITKSVFLFLILTFYACIFLFYGYAFGGEDAINKYRPDEYNNNSVHGCGYQDYFLCGTLTVGEIDLIYGNGYACAHYQCKSNAEVQAEALDSKKSGNILSFLSRGIVGIGNVPIWINAIVFTPLIIVLAFIIFTSLPTFNGGS